MNAREADSRADPTIQPMADGMADQIAGARARVFEAIADAARGAGRDPNEIRLVAITKGHPPEVARAAVAAGLTTLGENRVQEAAAKIPLVEGGQWHLVGPLQSNKAKRAIGLFDVIESIDSLEIARRLDRLAAEFRPGRPMPVLLQVNVDMDTSKSGFEPDALAHDLPAILDLERLRVDGLMTVGRLVASAEAARPTFRNLRALAERLRAAQPDLGPQLSMGMTDDYPVAIAEGATIVRIGRALFGERPTAGQTSSAPVAGR